MLIIGIVDTTVITYSWNSIPIISLSCCCCRYGKAVTIYVIRRTDHFGFSSKFFIRWVYFAIRNSDDDVARAGCVIRSEEHTSELQSRPHLVCRLLLEKKKKKKKRILK